MKSNVSKQVISGVRLAAGGVLALVVLVVLLDGELRLTRVVRGGQSSTHGLLAAGELLIVAVFLWLTVRIWSPWVAAIAFFGALKGLVGLVGGTDLMPPFKPVSRLVAAEGVAYLLAAGLLSVCFISRQPRFFERIALLILVFTTSAELLVEGSHIASLVALVALALARWRPGLFVATSVTEVGNYQG